MMIIKLGGSLYNTPELKLWMQTLVDYSKNAPIIIVPGGGPFADQVRNAQQHHKLSDKTAHHMAILAMKQFGLLLANIEPRSQLISSTEYVANPISIWVPSDSILSEPALPHNWTITSDSIALWLASKLAAKQLLLIKRAQTDSTSISQLTQNRIIDSAFARLFAANQINTKIIHYQDYDNFGLFLQQPSLSLP